MRNENKSEVEVQFDGVKATIIAEPVAMFRVIKALVNDGRNPEFRYHDDEIQGMTCWQPTKKAA